MVDSPQVKSSAVNKLVSKQAIPNQLAAHSSGQGQAMGGTATLVEHLMCPKVVVSGNQGPL